MIRWVVILVLFLMVLELEAELRASPPNPNPRGAPLSKGNRIRANRTEVKPPTKQLQAKNVPLGSTVLLAGGLGPIEVAEKTKTRGGLRLSEAPVLRKGNRRKRRLLRRSVIVVPSTSMEVVK